jgi:hypothetical protein
MCGYVDVCVRVRESLSVGQDKSARTRRQPSKSDPWSSVAAPHTSFSQACVMGPELFLDVQSKQTDRYVPDAGRTVSYCDWTVASGNSGSLLLCSAVSPSKSLPSWPLPLFSLLSSLSLSRRESLSQGLFPSPRTSCHFYRAESEPRTTLFSLAAPTVKISLGSVR